MRYTVHCDSCETWVARGDNLMDANEIKKRHDHHSGHDCRIERVLDTPLEGLL